MAEICARRVARKMFRRAFVKLEQFVVALAHDGHARAGGRVFLHEPAPLPQKNPMRERGEVKLARRNGFARRKFFRIAETGFLAELCMQSDDFRRNLNGHEVGKIKLRMPQFRFGRGNNFFQFSLGNFQPAKIREPL